MPIGMKLAKTAGVFLFLSLAAPLGAQTRIPLTVSMGDVSINKIPFLVALDQGLYEKHGLDVTMIPYGSGSATIHGIPDDVPPEIREKGEDAQITVGGGVGMMIDRVTESEPSDWIVLASTDHIVRWHIMTKEGTGINTLEDLKGKRLGISGMSACTGYIALMLAKRMGWDVDQDISIMQGNYSVTPLKEGWVDAFIAYEVPYALGLQENFKVIADLRDWNEPMLCSGARASRSWANANRDTVLRFLKALTEGIALMKKDRTVAFRSMEKWYGFDDTEVQSVIYYGAREMPRAPYPNVEGVKKVMELYDSNSMRRHKPEDFYDSSYIRELEESGFVDSLYE
jgi:ABC-type nitrate/sulfonate/bicarbonate transport system substrate-binding protein